MYSKKWNCAASFFLKQYYNFLSPNSYIHSYICERFIFFQDRSVYFAAAKYVDWSWEYLNRSQTHECGNWDWGRAIPRKGIHKWELGCSMGLNMNLDIVLYIRMATSKQTCNLTPPMLWETEGCTVKKKRKFPHTLYMRKFRRDCV